MNSLVVPFILCNAVLVALGADSDFIRCPTVWVRMASSDSPPSTSITVTNTGNTEFVIRAEVSGIYNIGRYNSDTGKAFVVSGITSIITHYFEILTNPHKCDINWKTLNDKVEHQIPSEENASKYVGRALYVDTYMFGQIEGNRIRIPVGEGRTDPKASFEVLECYSKGLELKMTKFKFAEDPFSGTNEFVGLDMIYNRGDTTIQQTVTQSKRILERTSISNTKTWSHTFTIHMTVQPELKYDKTRIPGPSFTAQYQIKGVHQTTEAMVTEKETLVEVTREVFVPPHTSVEICSLVMVKDNFTSSYSARGEYTAPGLTHEEILAILRKSGKSGTIQGNSVVVEETGKFGGTLISMTKFFVSNLDDPQGCSTISTEIENLKRAKHFGNLTTNELNAWNSKINSMLS